MRPFPKYRVSRPSSIFLTYKFDRHNAKYYRRIVTDEKSCKNRIHVGKHHFETFGLFLIRVPLKFTVLSADLNYTTDYLPLSPSRVVSDARFFVFRNLVFLSRALMLSGTSDASKRRRKRERESNRPEYFSRQARVNLSV